MKKFYIFAGPNGSGKSSVVGNPEILPIRIPDEALYINADYYAKNNQEILNMPESDARDKAAWNGTNIWRTKALQTGYEAISWETVFSHPSRLDVIREAKNLGYTVTLIYVTTINPKINIERVRIRAERGGHTVPDEKVISRYHRSVGMLPEMISLADEVLVYDNSMSLCTPLLVFGKISDECMVLNRDLQSKELAAWVHSNITLPLEENGTVCLVLDETLTEVVLRLNYA